MGYNGSGVFSVSINYQNDRDSGIAPQTTRFDASFSEVATGLGNAICRDGQQTVTANIPFNGHKITGLGDGSAATDALNLKGAQSGSYAYGVAGGSASAITAATSPIFSAYAAGMVLTFKAASDAVNGGTTIVWNGISGAKTILKKNAAIVAGDWAANELVLCIYDGTSWHVLSPWHHTDIPKSTWVVLWQLAAPAGYTMKTDAYDRLLMLADGTNYIGGQNGGSWTISGLSAASHTHNLSGLTSAGSAEVNGQGPAGGFVAASGDHHHAFTATTTGSGALAVTSDAAWRPLYTNCIFCQRN